MSVVDLQQPGTATADGAGELRLAALLLWRELRDVWGHVSARREDGFDLVMVRWLRGGRDEPVLRFDRAGTLQSEEATAPVELPLHTEIYRARPAVKAVVHAHPHAAVALSLTGETVRAVTQQSVPFGDGIPLLPGDFVDTESRGAELASAMDGRVAALLRGHGAVTVGESVAEAVSTLLHLEQTALQLVWASLLGGARPLPTELREHPLHRSRAGATVLWRQLAAELSAEAR